MTLDKNALRGVTGLAVIFVVLFHFFPASFPNGYLGVDLYFVVSGFFICKALKKSESSSMVSLVLGFYSKRLQRILPLYSFSIMVTILGIIWLLPNPSYLTARNPALKAVSLMTNQLNQGEETYFEQTSSALDFFTHTWSIAVEVQFCLLIPLIYLDVTAFKSSKLQFFLFASLALLSFIFYSFCSNVSGFYSVIPRIWQFAIGMLVFLLKADSSNSNQEKTGNILNTDFLKPYKFAFLAVLIYIATYSTQLPEYIARSLFTTLSGLFFLSFSTDKFLSNPIFVYIGNVSYSLYLFHWPIYVFWKFQWADNTTALGASLAASIMLAICIHETFEKSVLLSLLKPNHQTHRFIRKLSSLETWSVTVLLVFVILSAVYKDDIFNNQNWDTVDMDTNYSMETPEVMNKIWSKGSWSNLNIPDTSGWGGWNYRRNLPLDGTEKILIFGSSLAANIAKTIHEECQHKAKSVLQGTYFACEPLFPTSSGPQCSTILDYFDKNIMREQPDYAFMAARHLDMGIPFPKGVDKLDHDPVYIFAKQQLLNYTRHVQKKLFIVMPFPKVHSKNVEKIATWMKGNTHPEEIDRMLTDRDDGYKMARIRYEKLIEDCGEKCVPVDFRQEFVDEKSKSFRFFNFLGFSYITSDNNLTPLGIVRIRHIFREICSNL